MLRRRQVLFHRRQLLRHQQPIAVQMETHLVAATLSTTLPPTKQLPLLLLLGLPACCRSVPPVCSVDAGLSGGRVIRGNCLISHDSEPQRLTCPMRRPEDKHSRADCKSSKVTPTSVLPSVTSHAPCSNTSARCVSYGWKQAIITAPLSGDMQPSAVCQRVVSIDVVCRASLRMYQVHNLHICGRQAALLQAVVFVPLPYTQQFMLQSCCQAAPCHGQKMEWQSG